MTIVAQVSDVVTGSLVLKSVVSLEKKTPNKMKTYGHIYWKNVFYMYIITYDLEMKFAKQHIFHYLLQDSLCVSFFYESFWYIDSNSRILSKLFTQMWNMKSNSEGNTSDDEIIGQALSSQIYPKCVEAYCKYTANDPDLKTFQRGFNVHHICKYSLWLLVI